jgi:hypothetical protein
MVVLVLLAINVGQKLDQIISPNRFSGGLARPQLYLASFETENRRDAVKLMVALYSESLAEANTTVDPVTRKTVGRNATETFSGSYFAAPYPMLTLLAGISPGAIPIDGKQSPFIVPHFAQTRGYFYWDKDDKMHRAPAAEEQLTRNFLKLWSDTYANPVYPTRAFADYKNVRARIFVETGPRPHSFVIGHATVSAAQIKSGRLDFLTSMSSANTEVVYLGDSTNDFAARSNGRLDFFDKNGFVDAAKHLRSHLYPDAAELETAKDYYGLLATWDQLSPDQKSTWLEGVNGDATLARGQYEASIARQAVGNYNNALLEDALKKAVKPDVRSLPTILAYPDAWQAYVDYRLKANPTPPDWFVAEFLEPLGFDKRVVVIEQ